MEKCIHIYLCYILLPYEEFESIFESCTLIEVISADSIQLHTQGSEQTAG